MKEFLVFAVMLFVSSVVAKAGNIEHCLTVDQLKKLVMKAESADEFYDLIKETQKTPGTWPWIRVGDVSNSKNWPNFQSGISKTLTLDKDNSGSSTTGLGTSWCIYKFIYNNNDIQLTIYVDPTMEPGGLKKEGPKKKVEYSEKKDNSKTSKK